MAELGAASAIIGLVPIVLHGIRLLRDDIKKINGAPQIVHEMEAQVAELIMTVESLEAIGQHDWAALGPNVCHQCKTIMEACNKACSEHTNILFSWTKRSRDGKVSWRDRVKIGLLKERQVKAMTGQLQVFKLSLVSAVGVATLYATLHVSGVTEDTQKQLAARRVDVEAMTTSCNEQVAAIEQALEDAQPSHSADPQGDEDDDEDLDDAVSALRSELAVLKTAQGLSDSLLQKLKIDSIESEITPRSIESVTFGDNYGGIVSNRNYGSISGNTLGATSRSR